MNKIIWESLNKRVQDLELNTKAKENSDYYSRISTELGELNRQLIYIKENYNIFVLETLIDGTEDPIKAQKNLIEKVKNDIDTLLNKFIENTSRNTLTKDQALSLVKVDVENILESIETNLSRAWLRFKNKCYPSREPSSVIRSKIEVQDPVSKKLLKEFEEMEVRWEDLFVTKNVDKAKVEAVKKIGDGLEKLNKKLRDRETLLPESVKIFLASFTKNNQASLSLYNDEVKAWLNESGTENLYSIKRREI